MSRKRIIATTLAIAVAPIVFVYNTVDIATSSMQFDLRKIGETVYEAHS